MHASPRRQAIVEIATRDGRRLSRRTLAVRGTADNPMSCAEVEAKARDLIAGVLGAARAERIVRAARKLDTMADVGALARLCRPPRSVAP
jgi:hypothetical protein